MKNNLEFVEKTHEYYLNNRKVPSVTQILSPISDELYKFIDSKVLSNKASVGTLTHKCIELYTTDGTPADLVTDNERALNYFSSYLKFREDYKDSYIKSLKAEFQGSYSNGLVKYAGTIDNISLFKDGVTMIDYKTVDQVNEPLVALQLYGYKLIIEQEIPQLKVKHFKVLSLREDGTYNLIDLTNLVNDFQTKKLFEYFYEFKQLMEDYGITTQAKNYDALKI